MIVLQEYLDKAQNTGFRIHDQGIVTYSPNKLALFAYYDKDLYYLMKFIQDP